MNRIAGALRRALSCFSLGVVLLVSVPLLGRADTPPISSPRLPPPSAIVEILEDGRVIYIDGSILYPNGVYVLADGTIYYIVD